MTASAASIASPWTPEREARAVRLYLTEGFTAAEVADALGAGFSRAAIIGKIRRLGFLKREARATPCRSPRRALPPAARTKGVERRLPPQLPPRPLPPLREAPATGAPVPLAGLACGQCRWPVDDPGPGRMHAALFCAGPAVDGRYCAAHRAIAVTPRRSASPSARSRA